VAPTILDGAIRRKDVQAMESIGPVLAGRGDEVSAAVFHRSP
jgi:hypothetical protein